MIFFTPSFLNCSTLARANFSKRNSLPCRRSDAPGVGPLFFGREKIGELRRRFRLVLAEAAPHLDDLGHMFVEAELVDVTSASGDASYADNDVKGKIVLAAGSTSEVIREAVLHRGARGVLTYYAISMCYLAE